MLAKLDQNSFHVSAQNVKRHVNVVFFLEIVRLSITKQNLPSLHEVMTFVRGIKNTNCWDNFFFALTALLSF